MITYTSTLFSFSIPLCSLLKELEFILPIGHVSNLPNEFYSYSTTEDINNLTKQLLYDDDTSLNLTDVENEEGQRYVETIQTDLASGNGKPRLRTEMSEKPFYTSKDVDYNK